MNLFVVGVGLTPELGRRVVAELRRTSRLYPQLDHDALWERHFPDGTVLASVATAVEVAHPRIYVHEFENGALLYDGLPIEPEGTFAAHRAPELHEHWDHLTDTLEGRFGIVRVAENGRSVELLNDPIGVEQVFVHEGPASTILSNSAGLIQRVLGAREPDPLGMSSLLVLDWVASDRTLRRDVRVLPGGQHWRWSPDGTAWTKRTYWSLTDHGGTPTRTVDPQLVGEVIGPMARFIGEASRLNGTINAPISGGRDSRMLAAILIDARIPTRYWTKGDEGGLDVGIAREVAAMYGLPHQVSNRPTQLELDRDPTRDVGAEWESLSVEFVSQNDGLASLWYLANIQGQPHHVSSIAVTLAGLCLELSRGAYDRAYMFGPGASVRRTALCLPNLMAAQQRGLIRSEAFGIAIRHMQDTVARLFDEGVAAENLALAFYLDEKCRRLATTNPRELAQTEDKVLPALTRAYVASSLSIRPEDRWLGLLHHEVMRTLVPGLEKRPGFDKPWRTGLPPKASLLYKLRAETMWRLPHLARRGLLAARDRVKPRVVSRAPYSPYDEEIWLEQNLAWARDLCLSHPGSPLWAYLDRRKLEQLLADGTPQGERRLFQLPIFAALTMFLHEDLERSLAADDLGLAAAVTAD